MGLDIETIAGSGPAGRVQRADLEAAAAKRGRPAAVPTAQPAVEFAPQAALAGDLRRPLSQARKTIAATMAQSWSTIPHVTDCEDADITDLDRLRKGYAWPPPGPGQPPAPQRKLTILAFVIRAVCLALRRHPIFNSSYDSQAHEIIQHASIHLAVGVQTERGLIAPILREADRLSVAGIADALVDLSQRVREGRFAVNDLRGGTYTISNAGAMGGSRYSTPLITPLQVAVLAHGRTRWEPRVVDGHIVPRYILPLSHSFDHRIIDGAQEIAFQQAIIGALENPARLML
jgi:pyruvate dehydrogenase E2 component (dihydrolipoamide acetyltransferase)